MRVALRLRTVPRRWHLLMVCNAAMLRADNACVKKTIATLALFTAIAPNALLCAQVSQADPNDPTTTVVPAPGGGGSTGGRDRNPPDAPTQRAAPIPTQTVPASPAPAATSVAPVRQTEAPLATTDAPPAVQTPTPTPTAPAQPQISASATATATVQQPTETVAPTPSAATNATPSAPPATGGATSPVPASTTATSAVATTSAEAPGRPTPSTNPNSAGSSSPAGSTPLNTPESSAPAVSTTLKPTTVVTDGKTVTEVVPSTSSSPVSVSRGTRVVPQPSGVPVASVQAVEAAKVAPAVFVDPATPPPAPTNVTNVTNINTQITNIQQINIQNNTNVTVNNWRPNRWDYVDYDPYRRPILYNPCGEDVRYHYYYGGDYRDVWVPAGGRIVLNIGVVGVFPFVAVGSSFVSSGAFNGGAWIPPDDSYTGPPPPDWQPYTPTYYDNAYVNVPAANQSIYVNRVTEIGHDDTAPAGQQDSFMLDDTTLARGQISPNGAITLATAQKTPGVGPVTNGVDLVNLAEPLAPPRNNTPYYVGAALAVAALMGGVFWWVWRKGSRGAHGPGGDGPSDPTIRASAVNGPTDYYS